jgi:type II pantothenate kinase
MQGAIDLGITNIDTVFETPAGLIFERTPTTNQTPRDQVARILAARSSAPERVAVTGGRYRDLPEISGSTRLVKVGEVTAVGLGGLALASLAEALVVSAGSGTVMVAARSRLCTHVTGSAVGGGTLQGLGRLLLGTADALEIDALAQRGDANQADLTLAEAVGGNVGALPANANAVNFGRLARVDCPLSKEDAAAGLVRLVGQVIAVVAINAARAQSLAEIVIVGHLVDLPSVRAVLSEVSGYYQAKITVPANPGTGTALGAMLALNS